MTWSNKIYWCKPTPRHKVWHIDDATVSHWVTLCGQEYKHDAVELSNVTGLVFQVATFRRPKVVRALEVVDVD